MKYLGFCLILLLAWVEFACKKDHQNAETYFLYMDVTRANPKDTSYCFTKIFGKDREMLPNSCFLKQSKIGLPLNIAQDSSIFIFQKDTRFDTLKTSYSRRYQLIGSKYSLLLTGFKIYSSTFDSLYSTCGPKDGNVCSEQNDFKTTLYF